MLYSHGMHVIARIPWCFRADRHRLFRSRLATNKPTSAQIVRTTEKRQQCALTAQRMHSISVIALRWICAEGMSQLRCVTIVSLPVRHHRRTPQRAGRVVCRLCYPKYICPLDLKHVTDGRCTCDVRSPGLDHAFLHLREKAARWAGVRAWKRSQTSRSGQPGFIPMSSKACSKYLNQGWYACGRLRHNAILDRMSRARQRVTTLRSSGCQPSTSRSNMARNRVSA